MEKTIFGVTLLLLGLVLGSFVNAAVWRIKNKRNLSTDRSECVHCHYKLHWYDLIPIFSWLWLRGKCRECKKTISVQYPLVELAVATFFVASLAFWPHGFSTTPELLYFAIWLLAGVGLAILAVYDLRWMLLPDRVVFPLIGLGAAAAITQLLQADTPLAWAFNVVGSLAVLSGFYLALYVYSKGKWIGFGDVKLGIALGLLLCDWRLALMALFLSNLFGCIVILPGLFLKKLKRTSHIPFGPFLIAGYVAAGLFGFVLLDWYMATTFASTATYAY